jgi:hypothetical protein
MAQSLNAELPGGGLRRNAWLTAIAASTVDAVLVAAAPGRRILVHAAAISYGATPSPVTFNTKPAGAGAAIAPALTGLANQLSALQEIINGGWFETGLGEGLTVTTGAGSATSVLVQYSFIGA